MNWGSIATCRSHAAEAWQPLEASEARRRAAISETSTEISPSSPVENVAFAKVTEILQFIEGSGRIPDSISG